MQDNNLYNNEEYNDEIYRHSKLSNNPNEYQEDMKPDSGFEDRGIIDKNGQNKNKLNNNWDITTNIGKDNSFEKENNIDNDNNYNIRGNKKANSNEEKIDDDIPIQSKISGINNEDNNEINNINNENEYEENKENDEGNDEENEGNNNLILDDDENLTSKDEKGKNKGMSEKDY